MKYTPDYAKYTRIIVLKWFEDGSTQSIMLADGWEHVARQIDWLYGNGFLLINSNNEYAMSDAGRQSLLDFEAERLAVIQKYDVFSAVDLNEGTFAFAEYAKFTEPTEFQAFIRQERFTDLRLEVIEFENDDLPESVIAERIYDLVFATNYDKVRWFESQDWQFDLLVTSFEVINMIVSTTPSWKMYGDDEEHAKSILQEVIRQGNELKEELRFG